MLKRAIVCIIAVSSVAAGCQTAYDRGVDENPPASTATSDSDASSDTAALADSPDEAPRTTEQDSMPVDEDPVETDVVRSALTERQLREFVFFREDFPYEWLSEPSSPDVVVDDALLAINEDYERCLGVEVGTFQPVAELESDSFTSDGSFEVSSSVTQYVSSAVAKSEFDAMSTTSGRECFRQALRGALSYEFTGTDLFVSDVYVVGCEAAFDVAMPEVCLLTDIFIQGEEAGPDGTSLVLETYGFLRDDVVVSVSMLSSGSTIVADEELEATSVAVYQLLDRLATYTMT